MKNKHFSILILITLILICCIVTTVFGADVILKWEAPTTNVDGTPLTDLAGYRLYYGNTSKIYSTKLDVKNVLTYKVNLSDGIYYFAVTAYDTSGNESDYSNEITKMIDTLKPNAPKVTVIITVQ